MNYIIAAIGIAVLIYDGWLAVRGKKTISQRCQEVAPPAIDWGIGIAGWIALCAIKHSWPEFDFALAIVIAGLWGHMWIANKERYKGVTFSYSSKQWSGFTRHDSLAFHVSVSPDHLFLYFYMTPFPILHKYT